MTKGRKTTWDERKHIVFYWERLSEGYGNISSFLPTSVSMGEEEALKDKR